MQPLGVHLLHNQLNFLFNFGTTLMGEKKSTIKAFLVNKSSKKIMVGTILRNLCRGIAAKFVMYKLSMKLPARKSKTSSIKPQTPFGDIG